jgi:hypothetical protein
MIDHQHAPTALTGRDRAHEASGTSANDQHIHFHPFTMCSIWRVYFALMMTMLAVSVTAKLLCLVLVALIILLVLVI